MDGNEYIDYGMGNGALLLGHAHPAAIQAVQSVVENGLHFGNDHPQMLEWAGIDPDLIPCAERVRFDNSGTEGTMLALRLARAFTGQDEGAPLRGALQRLARLRRAGRLPAVRPVRLARHPAEPPSTPSS